MLLAVKNLVERGSKRSGKMGEEIMQRRPLRQWEKRSKHH